jgi:hypothetical protein
MDNDLEEGDFGVYYKEPDCVIQAGTKTKNKENPSGRFPTVSHVLQMYQMLFQTMDHFVYIGKVEVWVKNCYRS